MIYLRKETPLGYIYGRIADFSVTIRSEDSVMINVGIVWGMFDGDDFVEVPEMGVSYYNADDGQMNANSVFTAEEIVSEAGQLTLTHEPMDVPGVKNTVTGETYLLEETGYEEGNPVVTIDGLEAGQLCIVSYRHQPIVFTMVNDFPQRLRYRIGGGQGSVPIAEQIFNILIEYDLVGEATTIDA